MFAKVIVDISHESIDKCFTYRIPEDFSLSVGDPVLLPFGRGKKKGYVIGIEEVADFPEEKIKDILSPMEKEFSVDKQLLDLAIWMAEEYGTTLNQCLKTVLPVKKKTKNRTKPGKMQYASPYPAPKLNPEQEEVFLAMQRYFQEAKAPSALLFGVTGSGKTELYLRFIEECLAQGKEVIYLIPEISLSHQSRMRVEGRFPGQVAVLHSKMSQGERAESMEKCRSGEVKLLLGPRSALFAPFSNLGLIIIDEEQERSYKSETAPRYESRDVARKRGELANCPVLFGSATPSVNIFREAEEGKVRLFSLKNRAVEGSILPKLTLIDLRKELEEGNRSIFSKALEEAVLKRLERGEQSILFMNRRGYSPFVSCRKCGKSLKCPHCDVSLTLHKNGYLQCHYCGYSRKLEKNCPNCGSSYIFPFGTGTEKLEKICRAVFPNARILRMDGDTTGKKGRYEEILQDFAEEKADILLGTQMIVKGHDFPKVTLVGIMAAEQLFFQSDFQAREYAFQILTQAAGRAGRGKLPGEVLIQSYRPEEEVLELALEQDYFRFYRSEKKFRKRLEYPPFARMLAIQCSYQEEEFLSLMLDKTIKRIQGALEEEKAELFGPFPATIYKLKDNFRKIIYIKQESHDIIIRLRNLFVEELRKEDKRSLIQLQFDLL